MKIKYSVIIILLTFLTFNQVKTAQIDLDHYENFDTGFVNLGKCIVHLKNNNKLKGKVRMRFNFPVYGQNYKKGKLFIKEGFDKKFIKLNKVKEIRLSKILYPYKGIVTVKTKNSKEYPLKHYIVSREPIQLIAKRNRVFNLKFKVIKFIKVNN